MRLAIALDIGGTFTDLVAFDLETGAIRHAKSSTTPQDLTQGVARALTKSGLRVEAAGLFIHGSTIAINTAIERTGARTALLTTQGMRDVYQIGRGGRPEAYNFHFKRPEPYVRRSLTFELVERLNSEGEVLIPLATDSAEAAIGCLRDRGVEAAAVCLLHAWANPAHEERVGELLRDRAPEIYCSLSHAILREYREYERTSTTVLNAYVGPKVSRYLEDLEALLRAQGFVGRLLIMQSNGGAMSAPVARRIPVATLESGPVGGMIAAAETARRLDCPNLIAFDMGGTTAKVSLIQDNRPEIAQGYYVGGAARGLPIMYPVVDIVEVGTGGGSLAWIDEIGGFKVGPRSAGGFPGPVCYRQGGQEPTVTDANVVLGRLSPEAFLGGEMPLDVDGARAAIRRKIAEPLNMTVEEAALGIIRLAVADMALAVRSVSVARGHDPRDFALVAFGGAGPLHAAEIARELNIPTVIVPRLPGHFSALGMLLADLRHDFVRTYYKELSSCDLGIVREHFAEMMSEGADRLAAEGVPPQGVSFELSIDMRYVGQEFPIPTPISLADLERGDRQILRRAFDRMHDRRYGQQAVDESVELINLRATALGRRERLDFADLSPTERDAPTAVRRRPMVLQDADDALECPIYDRDTLGAGDAILGPATVSEYASTTLLLPGDVLTVAPKGELIIRICSAAP